MYHERTLSEYELNFVNKAQQKIADLGVLVSRSLDVGDVDDEVLAQVAMLQYVIDSLKTTNLDWSSSDIQNTIDFLYVYCELQPYSPRIFDFGTDPIYLGVGGGYVTIPEFNSTVNQIYIELNRLEDSIEDLSDEVDDKLQELGDEISNIPTEPTSSGITVSDMTAVNTVGGIPKDKFIPAGTSIEAIIKELLGILDYVSNFTFPEYTSLVVPGTTVTPSQYSWDSFGDIPSVNILSPNGNATSSTGSPVVPSSDPVTFSSSQVEEKTWILDPIVSASRTVTIKSRYEVIFGFKISSTDSPVDVDTALLNGGTRVLRDTALETVEVPLTVPSGALGWVAIPKEQTQGEYYKWWISTYNNGEIGSTNFILPPVEFSYNGLIYEVYRWRYRSPISDTLKLIK